MCADGPRPQGEARVRRPPPLALAGALAATLALAPGARADPPARALRLTMTGGAWVDAAWIAAGASLALGGLVLPPRRADLAPLDGAGARARSEGFGIASDLSVVGGVLVAGLLGVAGELERGARGACVLRAPLVLAEATVMALGLHGVVRNLVGACRPRAWDEATERCVGLHGGAPRSEDRRSFYSGHTTAVAALAGASWGMTLLPAGGRREFLPLAITATGLALATMALRVAAGAHSWVDTATGLLVGGAIGFGTAMLHVRTEPRLRVGASVGPLALELSAAF